MNHGYNRWFVALLIHNQTITGPALRWARVGKSSSLVMITAPVLSA